MKKSPLILQTIKKDISKNKWIYIMAIPVIVFYICFSYIPMAGIQIAFKDFNFGAGIWGSPWVGMRNFQRLFSNSQFRTVILNTLVISFGRILFTFFVPILVALLLNEIRSWIFKRTVQTIIYLPHFLSWVVIAGIAYSMLTINDGFINKVIVALGGQPVNFLLESSLFRPVVYLTGIWKEMGWETIIYLAALAGIDPGLYEAAEVDGAGRLQRMLHITWPGIKSTVVIMLILTVSRVMYAGMDQIINLYSSPVYNVGDIIDTYVYRELLMKSEFGLGTAAGLFQSLINLALVLCVNIVGKKVNDGEGLF